MLSRRDSIKMESGGDLLSRTVTSQVPSALKSLTSVFGMGTGGTSSSLPPEMVSYLGNRFSFCPLGLPYQRFHRPFSGTVGPFHRPFLPLPGPSDALRILTTAQPSKIQVCDHLVRGARGTCARGARAIQMLCFLLPMISLWTNHEIKPSTY